VRRVSAITLNGDRTGTGEDRAIIWPRRAAPPAEVGDSVPTTDPEAADAPPPVIPPVPAPTLANLVDRNRLTRRLAPVRRWARWRERERLLAAHPGLRAAVTDGRLSLRRINGRLRVLRMEPGQTYDEAVRANLDLVTALCARGGVKSFVVPGADGARARVGVPDADWDRFVAALEPATEDDALYVGLLARRANGRLCRWPFLGDEPAVAAAARSQRILEVFTITAASDQERAFDRPYACTVERWDADEVGGLLAPSRNPRSSYVSGPHAEPASAQVEGRTVRTLRAFDRRGIFDVDQPVDAVYLWVDGADPSWLAAKNAALAAAGMEVPPPGAADERFRDNGELRYSFRSVERFAPWIRRIYLVTDGQVPDWLDADHPRVRLVDHRELFAGTGTLPTFNSHALGARLHHIEGLSEHYLYMNDDVFFGRPVQPRLFFEANGVTRFFLSRSTLPFTPPEQALSHDQARRNVADLLERDFGRSPSRVFFHTPVPQSRRLLDELEERYPEVFRTDWNSQFRSRDDFEVNSWLHHYYGYLTQRSAVGSIRYRYFDVSKEAAWRQMHQLLARRDFDTFCVNDSAEATPEQHVRLGTWLPRYFPGGSSFECTVDPALSG
jgi:hypothetical protein